jgi:hypothetical protein
MGSQSATKIIDFETWSSRTADSGEDLIRYVIMFRRHVMNINCLVCRLHLLCSSNAQVIWKSRSKFLSTPTHELCHRNKRLHAVVRGESLSWHPSRWLSSENSQILWLTILVWFWGAHEGTSMEETPCKSYTQHIESDIFELT